jgi:RecA/RadA recombinase
MSRKKPAEADEEIAPELPSKRPGARVFAEIASRSKSFRQAREVLRRVRAVPTIFPALDYKLRVGGWPLDRVAMVHGPSAAGKSLLTLGLGLSFLRRGHAFALVDAECTTPDPWLATMLGAHADDPAFFGSRPESYEQAVDDVRKVALGIAEARDKKKLPPDTSCLFVVDSIGKLVPLDIQEKIRKFAAESEKGSVDGYAGASGMIKAALNKAWIDQLVPLMHQTGCAILFVVREAQDRDASPMARKFGSDWKTTGGASLFYDASLVIRVSRASVLHEVPDDWKSPVVGERHLVEIHKTKVSARQDVVEKCSFSTSNGAWSPEGFDRARDLLDLGLDLGVIKQGGGAWLSYAGNRWQGPKRFLKSATPLLLDEIEAEVRARFAEDVASRADVVGG